MIKNKNKKYTYNLTCKVTNKTLPYPGTCRITSISYDISISKNRHHSTNELQKIAIEKIAERDNNHVTNVEITNISRIVNW